MEYTKSALTYAQQVERLQQRGLIGDAYVIEKYLRCVNYYRLTAYWHPYLNADDQFRPDTTIQMVWRHYCFDRELRLLVMDALERVEVSIRTSIAYHLGTQLGAFGYLDQVYINDARKRMEFLNRLNKSLKNSKQDFARHFCRKYGEKHEYPPIWIAVELLTFGGLAHLLTVSPPPVQKSFSADYALPTQVSKSWLWTLLETRNIVAHHERLWNRQLGTSAKYPQTAQWQNIPRNRTFGIIVVLAYFMNRIAPESRWAQRIHALFVQYPDVDPRRMGLPEAWELSELSSILSEWR